MKRLILLCSALSGLFAAGNGLAQAIASAKAPYYVTGSVAATHSDGLDLFKAQPALFDTSGKATGYRLTAGRYWGPIWATELTYTDYGSPSFKTQDNLAPEAEAHGWLDAKGYGAWSVWRARTDMDIILVSRLGVAFNESRGVAREVGFANIDRRWSAWALAYGLGMEYDLPEGWRLHATVDASAIKVNERRATVQYFGAGLGRSF